MAWTATIKTITPENDRVEVLVAVTDGTAAYHYRYATAATGLSRRWVKQQVLGSIAGLATAAQDLAPGTAIDLSPDPPPVPPPPPAPPTPGELDRQQWVEDYSLLLGIRRAIDAGLLTGTEPFVITLRDSLRARFKPSYTDTL